MLVNCIVYQEGANDDLYIGTDVGVYHKDNSMSEWMPFNNGLPNVIVKELEIHYNKGTISAATFGRGIWESPLNTLSSVNTNNIKAFDFSIYPNPGKNEIIIKTNANNISTSIFSLTGQKIIETSLKKINTSVLAKGYYIVEVKNGEIIKRKKVVIK